MRIAITSDIHFFPQWADQIKRLADVLQARQPDLLILAGDIGEPLDMFAEGLRLFTSVASQRAAVAGNHDVWHRALPYTSERLWDSLLEETARAYGYRWLDRENLRFDSLGISGTIAWYDYGGRHPKLEFDHTYYECMKSRLSNDGNYVDWSWTDREFAARVGAEFIERLDQLERDPQIKAVLVVTHVPLFAQCLRPVYVLEQGILNAYYANVQLGEQVLERKKVRSIISGHVHIETQLEFSRQNGHVPPEPVQPVTVYTIPSDYGQAAALLLNTETWEAEIVRTTDKLRR